ncbi:hypothetical protein ACLOJK_026716 [Asimina triloba]
MHGVGGLLQVQALPTSGVPNLVLQNRERRRRREEEEEEEKKKKKKKKSKVILVRELCASLAEGHETYVLYRPEIGANVEKLQQLLSFKDKGAHLIKGSFSDHQSLLDAVKQVDVVFSAIFSGVHNRSHQILLQLKLVQAIKEAGNVKRFLPSEFGTDPEQMGDALEPGRVTFDDKMVVRKAIEEANIPFTCVSANCFAGYFLGGLCQPGYITPWRDTISLFGDGNTKGQYRTLYLRPPGNILSQREVDGIWEKLIEKQLEKSSISAEDFLAMIKEQVGLIHYYHVFYDSCLTNFKIGEKGVEASELYPEVQYTTAEQYLKRYL